jgi:hypothetical protein
MSGEGKTTGTVGAALPLSVFEENGLPAGMPGEQAANNSSPTPIPIPMKILLFTSAFFLFSYV